MENQTGDPRLAYVATGIAADVARRLEGIGGMRVRRGVSSDWPAATHQDVQTIWRELGSTVVLRSNLRKVGDSLQLDASVADAGTCEERTVAAHKFSIEGIRAEEGRFAAEVAGAIFRTAMPVLPRISNRPIAPESYRLMLEGWHELLSNIQASPAFGTGRPGLVVETPATRAIDLFTRAVNIDPLNARAWAGISSAWASQAFSGSVGFEESYDRASAAAMHALALDSLQGSAWANLAIMRALKYRSVAAGAALIQKAEAAEPSNPEIFMIKANLYREAHLYDQARDAIRVARELDPITPFYIQWEANLEFCADRPEVALQLNETEAALNPSNQVARIGVTRALAMLGRYDEAIASWRKEALALGDTSRAAQLATVHGRSGYWSQKHADGRKRLESLRRRTNGVLPVALMQAEFAAGDADAGFRTLDAAAATDTRALYRLRCMRDLDEFRTSPRFEAAHAKIGALSVR
jgi:tetratricopeptide (TPR) repeat protein